MNEQPLPAHFTRHAPTLPDRPGARFANADNGTANCAVTRVVRRR